MFVFRLLSPLNLARFQFRGYRRKGARKPIYDEKLEFLPAVNPLAKCEEGKSVSDDFISPFAREKPMCMACKFRLDFNYKNTRLLSQFLSSFTGRLYEKHQTGLCDFQQNCLRNAIWYSRRAALMPILAKESKFMKDPKLFDPMNPSRPNPYTY